MAELLFRLVEVLVNKIAVSIIFLIIALISVIHHACSSVCILRPWRVRDVLERPYQPN